MSDRDITAGVSISASGKFQLPGQQALNGILLWRAYVNAEGGIRVGSISRPVRLIWYDDASRANRTRENVLRLLRNDCVDILLGPYSSHLTMGAADIAEEHHKILWNYGGTSDEIFSRGWQYIVGIASPASDYFRALPRWLAKKDPELRRIGVLYSQKGTFGTQVNRGVLEAAQETGHSVHSVPLNSPLEDSGAVPLALREANPEALVLAGSFQDELAIMRTRLRWPSTVGSVAAVAAGIDSFGSVLGQRSEGVLGPSQWEPCPSLPPIVGPTSNWFVDAFHKEFGAAPNYIAAGSFATGLIAADCIRQAASLDSERVGCVAYQLDCNTFYGRFRIDSKTGKQVGHRVVLVRWQRCTKNVLPSGGPTLRG